MIFSPFIATTKSFDAVPTRICFDNQGDSGILNLFSSILRISTGIIPLFLVVLISFFPEIAAAQLEGSASVSSDYDYRGVSLTNQQPSISISTAYDFASGAYGGGSVIGQATQNNGPQLLGDLEYAGYAQLLKNSTSFDVGISNFNYKIYISKTIDKTDGVYKKNFTSETDAVQAYIGLSGRNFGVYNYYSPSYFGDSGSVFYTEAYVVFRPAPRLRLFAHAGALTPLAGQTGPGSRNEEFDLRAGVAAEFKHAEIQLAWTTRRPNLDRLGEYGQGHDALMISASWVY